MALVAIAGLAGSLVVGPFLSHAVLRWMGWRVTLPLLFGHVPPLGSLGHRHPTCRRCSTSLNHWALTRPTPPELARPALRADTAAPPAGATAPLGSSKDPSAAPGSAAPSPPERNEAGVVTRAIEVRGPATEERGLPIWPWLGALGRCRACRDPLVRWPLLVELATGLLFALAVWRLDDRRSLLPAVLVLFAGLVAVSTVDLLCSRIPTRFVYVTAAAVAAAAVPRLVEEPGSWVGAAVGGALCLVGLGVMHVASPAMLGFGDVRLGALIGAVVGWAGWTAAEPVFEPISRVVQVVFLAGVVGTVVGVALLVVRRTNQAYPFGPCLAFGAVVILLTL